MKVFTLLVLAFISLNSFNLFSQTSTIDGIIIGPNNVSGGGFQSDVTISEDGQTVYSASDVSGVSRSTNGGLLYNTVSKGLKSAKVASLAITPDNDQIIYAGTGDKGTSGGLCRSTDGGDNWALTAAGSSAKFAGNHSATSDPIPTGHPRPNGDLIIVDRGSSASTYTDDIVIAGTYKDGVVIFTKGGDVKASAVNTSGFVRAVAYNDAIPNTVYAGIYFEDSSKNGIYKINYTNPSSPTSTLVYQTAKPEGITVLSSGRVYAAIGDSGIVKYNGSSWVLKNSGLDINNSSRQWSAITGYYNGTKDILYAGVNNIFSSTSSSNNYSSVWRSVDNGNSWTPLVDASSNVSDVIYGQSYEWWFSIKGFPAAALGHTNSVVSSIDIYRGAFANVASDDVIYVSGRGGIWISENGGTSWQPSVYNMQVTANNYVAVNPNNPNQVVLGNTDYAILQTSTAFEGSDMARDKPSGAESKGYSAIFDVTSNEVIVGIGDRDTNSPGGGEVYIKSTTALGNPTNSGWTKTNLEGATSSNNGRVRAVTYGYHNGSSVTSQTILAVVEGEGVFRYHNGTWSKSNGITIGSTLRSNFVWPDNRNSGVVYLLDLQKGLYRSNDGGQNWSNIWPSMNLNNNDYYYSGYITADDNDPTTLYVSIQGGSGSPIGLGFKVYRLTGANSGTFGTPGTAGISDISFHSDNAQIKRPGPIVFGPNGRLWLTEQQDAGNSVYPGLFVMENPKTDQSFSELTTTEYRNAAISPTGMDVSSDGYVYIAQQGVGVLKIEIVSSATGVDEITSINAPLSVEPGSTVTASIDYSATTSRDIIVSFKLSSTPNTTYYTETKTVSAGTGTATFDIVLPTDVPLGVDLYKYQAILTTVDGGWAEKFNYVALTDVDVITTNELSNYNFEQGVDVNWSPSVWGGGASTTFTAASSNVYEGSVAYQLDVTTAVNIGNVSVQSDVYTVDMEGKTLDVSAWVKAEGSGQSFRFQITFYDIHDNLTSVSSSIFSLPLNSYEQYSYSVAVPAGSVKFKVRLQSGAVEGTYYFDYVKASLSNLKSARLNGIEEKTNNFNIYPNPAGYNDYINIISDNEISKVDIYNFAGKLMHTTSHIYGQVNISALSRGIYIIKVTESNGDVKQGKLIINE